MKKIMVLCVVLFSVYVVGLGILILKPKEAYNAEQRLQAVYNRLKINVGEYGTPKEVIVIPSNAVNAYTDGENIGITEKLLSMIKNDDQLALILAHELSHIILHDPETTGISQSLKEAHADKLGAFIIMKAGFDICKGREIFKKLFEKFGDTAESSDHPGFAYRYNQLSLPDCRG